MVTLKKKKDLHSTYGEKKDLHSTYFFVMFDMMSVMFNIICVMFDMMSHVWHDITLQCINRSTYDWKKDQIGTANYINVQFELFMFLTLPPFYELTTKPLRRWWCASLVDTKAMWRHWTGAYYLCIMTWSLFVGRGFYVAIGGGVAQYGWSHIMDILQDKKFDCQLTNHSEDLCLLSVQGPKR